MDIVDKCSICGKAKSADSSFTSGLPGSAAELCQCSKVNQPETTADSAAERVFEKATLAAGDLVSDRYEVLAHIGSGGMGEVYKVLDRSSGTIYALKMINPRLAQQKLLAKRLEHEARAARTLVHGNIVSVYDVGESVSGAPYLIMDYIDGDSLENLLVKEVVLEPSRAINISMQIAEALVHAKQKGIVHRDLKPSNILMTKTPAGEDMVKIVDFGIAKISDQEKADKTKLTAAGELLGTPLYMSPEQCRGDELDARSDIYSFGCIMYEMLTGHPPFEAENPVRVILKHLSEAPPPLPTNAKISNDHKRMIMRCLAKLPEDRYPTAVDLHIDLERIHDGIAIKHYKRKIRITGKQKLKIAAALIVVGTAGYLTMHHSTQQPAVTPMREQQRPQTYKGKTLTEWTSLIEASPNDPQLYFSRAELHAMRDERTNAVDDLTEALKLKPDFIAALKERVTMNALLANYDKAEKDADTLIKLDPDSAGSYETRGWVYGAREQYSEAIADWNHAISLEESGYYKYQLANNLIKLARYDEARKAIQGAIGSDSQSANMAMYRGVAGSIATFTRDFDNAQSELKQATELPEARGVEWAQLAYLYVCLKRMAEADAAVSQAKMLETFPARSYRIAGELDRTAGRFDKALQELSASTSLEEYPPGYRQRAVVYISLGQWRSALADLTKSIQLNPYSNTTLSYLALVENRLGKVTESKQHIAKAFTSRDLAPIIYVNRSSIELADGDEKKALDDANKAISLDPWLKEGYEVRGQIHAKQHNDSAATADRDAASKLVSHLDL